MCDNAMIFKMAGGRARQPNATNVGLEYIHRENVTIVILVLRYPKIDALS